MTHILQSVALILAAALMPFGMAGAATVAVTQTAQAFDQPEISIRAGDHVVFKNTDDVDHNILVMGAADDEDGLDMGVQVPGAQADVTFDKAGKFKVRCHIHPRMKMTVEVR